MKDILQIKENPIFKAFPLLLLIIYYFFQEQSSDESDDTIIINKVKITGFFRTNCSFVQCHQQNNFPFSNQL